MILKALYISLVFLLLVHIASAAPVNDYKITYTINVNEGGNAVWYVEYRTPLVSTEDFDSFDNYTKQLNPVHLNDFKELMQKSVSEAANATSRKMAAGGFTGDAKVESAPTGTFGVVRYSFTWVNFAKLDPDKNLNIGDVFIGGLYLSKDNTLIIQYPSGYTIEQVEPQPDQVRDGMVWYGLRSFKAGEPAVILSMPSSSWMPPVIAVSVIFIIAAFVYKRKARGKNTVIDAAIEPVAEALTEEAMMDVRERIIKLLNESGGSLYQSEIGKKLDIPRSTVSAALNQLHDKNVIQKIKKGRENLIRLVQS
ncbi:helix-turn-helix transcriptional regulator [Candidatus Methanoperedens nitratireducens]|uniref:Putative membrane-associated protein/domain protein n=1 Tax=Candidatus Methanoperedens nitratireducens TaxID=1392998 RepID=A0A284VIQ5_9EURY|nr:ArsR family transcriptional regulator [Candidatus Methanoperedens nitroreducens]SNQ59067.1 putative membrane-associated protein/domain protein [Candidatus Methanoperedens nitroreducens]